MTPFQFIIIMSSTVTSTISKLLVDDEDGSLTTPQIITKYGYKAETHRIETYDGYIVEMHRLTVSPSSGKFDPRKPPVLMMHGLLGSSADWIMIGPHNGLSYLLSDRGYDVWLGNARGNRYSREHTYLTADMTEYWDFTWHEIGVYDVPAMIDYVLKVRNFTKLHYVGYSQGTTAFLVMTSSMPKYNEKIIKLHAMAPAAYMSHLNNPVFRYLSSHLSTITNLVSALGVNQFMPASPMFPQIASAICSKSVQQCFNIMFVLSVGEYKNLNPQIIPILVGHIPAGASAKQIFHYAQEITSGHFRQYDYGVDNNTEIYHRLDPPDYDLSKVLTPVAIYYSLSDQLAHPSNVGRLAQELPNLVSLNQLPNPAFSHMDFILSTNAKDELYQALGCN
ncbi:lipase 1-like isoform X2 [Armigeres subalbatus]|uniref:lipase 1-like isoform X2 n=1 Tax=Armigeres subalbatus TaxID=124917 RepID=UPI002ED2869C